MEPTHDSRRTEDAAAEKAAGPGGNGTRESARNGRPQSGAPHSWRQYIEETLPARDTGTAAEQPAARGTKADARAAWAHSIQQAARWARERGRRARIAAAAYREKLGPAVGAARQRLSSAVAAARENLGPGVEQLGRSAKKVRAAVARHPISPLLYVTLLAVVIGVAAFHGNYARAYVLEVNGQKLGLVTGEDEVNAILGNVETRAASLLGGSFDYEVNVTLSPVYAAPGDLTDAAEMEDALFEGMGAYVMAPAAAEDEDETVYMTAWVLSVDGVEMGVSADKDALYQMLDEIAQPYLPENAVYYEFVEDVQIYPVELPADTEFEDLEPIREELSSLRVEEAVYVVQAGDTFNAIAYSLDMWPNQLSALNPDVMVDLLMIGQKLTIQQAVPRLSVIAVTDETYEQIIPSPVEYIGTADMYEGDTKLKSQGGSGLALVTAKVTYLNNTEAEREILETTTLQEPTTTYTYIGTTPRPSTASKGYFIWPVYGTITSYFGYRYIFGGNDYHLGLDIAVPTGTAVKAADGGTVIKSGWEGSYGYLVALRHDNGMITYYGHNSSLLVNVGDKVYQGQTIAKSGASGNVTGPHCHFEIRVNGTSVNPLNYLS